MGRAATTAEPARRAPRRPVRQVHRAPRRLRRGTPPDRPDDPRLAKPAPTTNGAPMLLDKKTAIVYGAAGAIGSAVACAYAREGADVHLVGRTQGTLDQVAQRIRADGGAAHVACLDVLDRATVEEHASAVAAASGGIDACFNATSNDALQGISLTQMQPDDFLRPVIKAVTAHFNIATAAGRQMTRRGSGVILVMAGGREAIPRL